MAKVKMVSVYDSAVGAYLPPQFLRSKGEAIRAFINAIGDPKSQFFQHPADYTLFELGEFDDQTGRFEIFAAPIPYGTALEFSARLDNGRVENIDDLRKAQG